MFSGSEWQASIEWERRCRQWRGGGCRAGSYRGSWQMANIRLPGNLPGQVPDRLAPARHRFHGATSELQLHRASPRGVARSVYGQCQWYTGGVHRVAVRQKHVHGDDNIAGKFFNPPFDLCVCGRPVRKRR